MFDRLLRNEQIEGWRYVNGMDEVVRMDRQTKRLNFFYWVLVTLVGLALLATMYAAAAFIALVLIVSQLSEIATYLQHLLKAQAPKGEATDGPQR